MCASTSAATSDARRCPAIDLGTLTDPLTNAPEHRYVRFQVTRGPVSCPSAHKALSAFVVSTATPPKSPAGWQCRGFVHPTCKSHLSTIVGVLVDRQTGSSPTASAPVTPPAPKTPAPAPTPAPTPAPAVETVGSYSHATDGEFCSAHSCIGSFTTEGGAIVECSDGTYSHSGGISGACSDHGGELK
jgi:hypothetical protein